VLGAAGKLRADVLLAPHHGSGTSSTPAFLQAVRPALGVFQVGYRNRYRHPKTEIYERYREMGIGRMRTDEAGSIIMHFGAQVNASAFRSEHARYWYGQ
jgi:competence protein ComEC